MNCHFHDVSTNATGGDVRAPQDQDSCREGAKGSNATENPAVDAGHGFGCDLRPLMSTPNPYAALSCLSGAETSTDPPAANTHAKLPQRPSSFAEFRAGRSYVTSGPSAIVPWAVSAPLPARNLLSSCPPLSATFSRPLPLLARNLLSSCPPSQEVYSRPLPSLEHHSADNTPTLAPCTSPQPAHNALSRSQPCARRQHSANSGQKLQPHSMRKCDASAAQQLQPGMRKCDARAARRSEPYTKKPTHRTHVSTQGRQGAPPTRAQPEWAVASINVDRLSQAKWTKLTQYLALQSPPVIACAIQHHQLRLWAELDDGEYEFWGNECGVGAKEGAAGGVGWAVHRKYKHMFTEHTGRGEGPNVKWLKMNHNVYLVSVYVPPGVAHTAAANDLMAHMVATQHMPCIWMGDVNIHFDGDSPLQVAWEGMCVRSRMTALDMEGSYARLPTRTPRPGATGIPNRRTVPY